MRNILITNDDGICSDGIIRLATVAKDYGEVFIIAPDSQRSAMSHSITLRRKVTVWQVDFPVPGVKAYACDGNPADCVRIGISTIMPTKPDCVLSGINYGYNVASDLQYSATVGAAFEGVANKVQAIAFSEEDTEIHEVTDRYIKEILEELLERPLKGPKIWNVNFPGVKLSECKGIKRDVLVSQDEFYRDTYNEEKISDMKSAYMVEGHRCYKAEEGTDLRTVIDNYVSIGIVTNIS